MPVAPHQIETSRRQELPERPRTLKNLHVSLALGVSLTLLLLVSDPRWGYESVLDTILHPVGLLLVGLGLTGRLWGLVYYAGYNNRTLLTKGPYSITRNPLYLCNWLGGFGATLTTGTLTVPLLFSAGYGLQYFFVVRREETKLRRIHGQAFERYRRSAPALLPAWSRLREPEEYPVRTRLYRAKMADAFGPLVALALLHVNLSLHLHGVLPALVHLY